MAEVLSANPAVVLAVYAHPDDADVSCGGALARWAAAGADVQLLVCTLGDKGTVDPEVEPSALAARRQLEVAAAADRLGLAGHHQLDYPDGELVDGPALRLQLVGWIRRLRPDTVLCPDPTAVFFGEEYYNHRDHRVLGHAVLDAVSPAAALPHYFPEAGPPHQVELVLLSGTLEPQVWVDIDATVDAKVAAVTCHRSQFPDDGTWAGEAVRRRAVEDGRAVGLRHAEGFRRLRLGG